MRKNFRDCDQPGGTDTCAIYQSREGNLYHFPLLMSQSRHQYLECDNGYFDKLDSIQVEVAGRNQNLQFIKLVKKVNIKEPPLPAPAPQVAADQVELAVTKLPGESNFDAMKRASQVVMAKAITEKEQQRNRALAPQQQTLSPRAEAFRQANLQSILDKH